VIELQGIERSFLVGLADEPTGNLDRASGEDVIQTLEGLNAKGMTLVVVTHDPALGARARRRIRMADGAVVEDLHPGSGRA
jgi:putative ABC transport system ATP-binding protein